MNEAKILIDSTVAGFTNPVAWQSQPIAVNRMNARNVSFHIYWQDVGLTFYLWRGNYFQFPVETSPPWDDITIAYRAIDVAWVDPVVGDPLSEHVVSFDNVGSHYVVIGYTAGNWAGVAPFIQIHQSRSMGISGH